MMMVQVMVMLILMRLNDRYVKFKRLNRTASFGRPFFYHASDNDPEFLFTNRKHSGPVSKRIGETR